MLPTSHVQELRWVRNQKPNCEFIRYVNCQVYQKMSTVSPKCFYHLHSPWQYRGVLIALHTCQHLEFSPFKKLLADLLIIKRYFVVLIYIYLITSKIIYLSLFRFPLLCTGGFHPLPMFIRFLSFAQLLVELLLVRSRLSVTCVGQTSSPNLSFHIQVVHGIWSCRSYQF